MERRRGRRVVTQPIPATDYFSFTTTIYVGIQAVPKGN